LKQEIDEKALLEGLASNDKKAIETIYEENYTVIQSLIINNNGSAEDAKDIFQEAMIVLFEKVRSGKFELSCLIKTYLYAVSRRLWLKKLHFQNRNLITVEKMESEIAVEDDVGEHDKQHEEFEMMEKAINSLGEPCKSLLEAYYLQKRNMQDIATSFGYTNAANAKNQKYKCLIRLKKIFFSHYKNGNGDG